MTKRNPTTLEINYLTFEIDDEHNGKCLIEVEFLGDTINEVAAYSSDGYELDASQLVTDERIHREVAVLSTMESECEEDIYNGHFEEQY